MLLGRRKRNRIPTDIFADLYSKHGQQSNILKVQLKTLSPVGLSLVSTHLISDLNNLKIKIRPSAEGPTIDADIKKAWHHPITDDNHEYGFYFSKLRAIDYKALTGMIENRKEEDNGNRRRGQRRLDSSKNSNREDRRNSGRRWRLPTYSLYIDGRDIDTGDYEYCPYIEKMVSDPRGTREIIGELKAGGKPKAAIDYIYGRYCMGDDSNNREAIRSAKHAFDEFQTFSISKKRKIFDDIHRLLLKHREDLLSLFVAEGHPRKLGEWEFSGMLRAFTAETVSFYRSELAKEISDKSKEATLLVRKPDGVICLSPPRNASASNSLTGALALLGGNSLVVKPPSTLPISTIYLWRHVVDEALRLNGAPVGTVNIVVGNTAKFINEWIKNPLVQDVIYFGESERGLAIGSKIFAGGKKPILELSGKDMMVVWEDADLEGAANSLLDAYLGSTQICMVPKMALVHEKIFDKFKEIFVAKIKQLRFGLPSDNHTYFSPVSKINVFYEFLEDAINKGARLIEGGKRVNFMGLPTDSGEYLQPTVIEINSEDDLSRFRCVKEEIFFPLVPLIRMGSSHTINRNKKIFEKTVEILNQNDYGLRVSAWTKSDTVIRKLIKNVHHCGLLRINVRHVDFSERLATHGGPGKTGGPYGELNYFWQKTTHLQGISVKI